MHPVLQHVNARKNGIYDNRKIAMVLYGGIMLGVRGAGALSAIEDLGLSESIDDVFAMSSGFLNASYFLSGQMSEGLRVYSEELSGHKFLNPWRFWKIADLEYLLSVINSTHSLVVEKVLQNNTQLHVMLINTDTHIPEFLEVHSFTKENYLNIVRAAASLPFIGNGSAQIGNFHYRDIFSDDNIPKLLEHVLSTDATDIVVFYNYPWQQKYVHAHIDLEQEGDRMCEITLWDHPMNRFETDSNTLREAGEFARRKMNALLLLR